MTTNEPRNRGNALKRLLPVIGELVVRAANDPDANVVAAVNTRTQGSVVVRSRQVRQTSQRKENRA